MTTATETAHHAIAVTRTLLTRMRGVLLTATETNDWTLVGPSRTLCALHTRGLCTEHITGRNGVLARLTDLGHLVHTLLTQGADTVLADAARQDAQRVEQEYYERGAQAAAGAGTAMLGRHLDEMRHDSDTPDARGVRRAFLDALHEQALREHAKRQNPTPQYDHLGPFVTWAVIEDWALLKGVEVTVTCEYHDVHPGHEGAVQVYRETSSRGYVPARCPGIKLTQQHPSDDSQPRSEQDADTPDLFCATGGHEHTPAVAVLVHLGQSEHLDTGLCRECATCTSGGCGALGDVQDAEYDEPWCTRHAEQFGPDERVSGPDIVPVDSERFRGLAAELAAQRTTELDGLPAPRAAEILTNQLGVSVTADEVDQDRYVRRGARRHGDTRPAPHIIPVPGCPHGRCADVPLRSELAPPQRQTAVTSHPADGIDIAHPARGT